MTKELIKLIANELQPPAKVKVKPKVRLSAKASAVVELLESGAFGCHTEHVRSLMSIVLEKELPKVEKTSGKDTWPVGTVLRILNSDESSHKWPDGALVVVLDQDTQEMSDGAESGADDLNYADASEVTPATKAEIAKFVKSLKSRNVQQLAFTYGKLVGA